MHYHPTVMAELARGRQQQLLAEAAQHRMAAEAARTRRAIRATSLNAVARFRQALGRRIVALGNWIGSLPAATAVTE
jgi:hypothetical protein